MIRVVIAEDHPTTTAGTKNALRPDPDIRVVGEAADGRQLRALLAKGSAPDILLLDIRMPDFEILEELPKFKERLRKGKEGKPVTKRDLIKELNTLSYQ